MYLSLHLLLFYVQLIEFGCHSFFGCGGLYELIMELGGGIFGLKELLLKNSHGPAQLAVPFFEGSGFVSSVPELIFPSPKVLEYGFNLPVLIPPELAQLLLILKSHQVNLIVLFLLELQHELLLQCDLLDEARLSFGGLRSKFLQLCGQYLVLRLEGASLQPQRFEFADEARLEGGGSTEIGDWRRPGSCSGLPNRTHLWLTSSFHTFNYKSSQLIRKTGRNREWLLWACLRRLDCNWSWGLYCGQRIGCGGS